MLRRREPTVISVHLLTTVLEAEAEERASKLKEPVSVARPPVNFSEVTSLSLSFRGLLRVENLQSLKALRKLQLDNNSLTRIENLEPLANLEWLDLSFNLIRRIEGVGHLKKLRDLSLYSNQITAIEGLEGCTALQVVSLGRNKIADLDSILYFRKLKHVEALTLEGNPLCGSGPADSAVPGAGDGSAAAGAGGGGGGGSGGSWELYRAYAHAFLPYLRYLDFQLITDAERTAALEAGVPQDKKDALQEQDRRDAEAAAKAKEREGVLTALRAANLDAAETVFEDMTADEPELHKLRLLPSLPTLLQNFREALEPHCVALKANGGEKNAAIESEMAMFAEAAAATLGAADAETQARIATWEAAFEAASRAFHSHPTDEAEGRLKELLVQAEEMGDEASKTELRAHEAMELMLDAFESALSELRVAKLALQEAFFRGVEAAEGLFTTQMHTAAVACAATKLPPDTDEDFLALLTDKEALGGALAGAHEARVARILKREADLKQREEKRCSGAVAKERSAEVARNRARLYELKQMVEECHRRVAEAIEEGS